MGALAGDTELLKITHDEARRLLKNSDDDEARAVIEMAKVNFADKLCDIAMN